MFDMLDMKAAIQTRDDVYCDLIKRVPPLGKIEEGGAVMAAVFMVAATVLISSHQKYLDLVKDPDKFMENLGKVSAAGIRGMQQEAEELAGQ